ncbi:hypothetical protein D7Y41_02375 [Anaerotruncus sp. 1XD22-93]|nr:hypothetical protein [Lachnospiraceae bacterium]NBI74293.1 hypothetical protein [Lachnospiraceae bacterium]RKK00319.1 hypothetical protein D7Y41_02375 [Anaerotruncus sp. 1XD22-93]
MKRKVVTAVTVTAAFCLMAMPVSASGETVFSEDSVISSMAESMDTDVYLGGETEVADVRIMNITVSPKATISATEDGSEKNISEAAGAETATLPKTGDFSFFERVKTFLSNLFYGK